MKSHTILLVIICIIFMQQTKAQTERIAMMVTTSSPLYTTNTNTAIEVLATVNEFYAIPTINNGVFKVSVQIEQKMDIQIEIINEKGEIIAKQVKSDVNSFAPIFRI